MNLAVPRRRWWLLAGAVVVVLAGSGIAVRMASASTRSGPAYREVAATTGTLRLTTAAGGTLEPAQQADLNFAVAGQVSTVDVTVGQAVQAGQRLATVNSATLAAQEAQAQATLDNDQARLSADQTAGAASAQVSADQAAVSAADAGLTNSRAALSDATLTSPIAGTVASLNLTPGQQVTGSGGGSSPTGQSNAAPQSSAAPSSTGGSTAQVVVVGKAFVADVPVDDTQIGLMADGEAAIVVPQGGTAPVPGTVTSVGLLASSTSGVASFPVVITVTGTPTGLYAGATASVTIVYRQLDNVLEVPTAAVHYAGGKANVLQDKGGQAVAVPVTVGLSAGGYTQITGGLSAGQLVLLPVVSTPRASGSGGTRGGGGFGGGGFGGGGLGGGGFGGGGGGLRGGGGGGAGGGGG